MMELIIVLVCLAMNALFSCFEMAFVTATKPQLLKVARDGKPSSKRAAEKILVLRENPERALSVIQIGITLVGFISAAVGGAGAEEFLSPIFESNFGLSEHVSEAISIGVVVIPLTLLNVVVGELVPKSIALRSPVRIVLNGARWIILADRIFLPVVSFLEAATKALLAILPKRRGQVEEEPVGAVELETLSEQTQQYVLNLVKIESRRVGDVMIPWSEVSRLQEDDPLTAVTATVIASGHTRLPVCRGSRVIGMLHAKEFIAMIATRGEDWHRMIRPVAEIGPNETSLRALRLLQSKRTHICIVTTPEHDPLGILTLEDILEEVVGELFDEDDDGRVRRLLASAVRTRAIKRR